LAGQDLAAGGAVAEPFGDDHGSPEIIVFAADGLPEVQANAQGELGPNMAPLVVSDAPLDGQGTGDRVDGASEDGHEPVAEVLHLATPVGADRFPQEGEVRPAEFLGALFSQLLEEIC
jgi:hypothetical protein